jgi:hypothetical protein
MLAEMLILAVTVSPSTAKIRYFEYIYEVNSHPSKA